MPETDVNGRLVIDENSSTPIRAWAILSFADIDPERIFLRREDAGIRASLELEDSADIIPVIVTGRQIQRA